MSESSKKPEKWTLVVEGDVKHWQKSLGNKWVQLNHTGCVFDPNLFADGTEITVRPPGAPDPEVRIAELEALAKRHSDRIEELVKMLDATAPVIVTEPGVYQTARYEDTGEERHLANVVAIGIDGETWIGTVDGFPEGWTDTGRPYMALSHAITGPYVAPQPDIGQTLITRLKDFTAALEGNGDVSKFRITRVQKSADGMQVIREEIPADQFFVEPR